MRGAGVVCNHKAQTRSRFGAGRSCLHFQDAETIWEVHRWIPLLLIIGALKYKEIGSYTACLETALIH